MEKAPLFPIGVANFAHQFDVTRIGAQRIHREIGPKRNYADIVFLKCGVEPFEGVFLVAQIGI
jgi:hypothetical protein